MTHEVDTHDLIECDRVIMMVMIMMVMSLIVVLMAIGVHERLFEPHGDKQMHHLLDLFVHARLARNHAHSVAY